MVVVSSGARPSGVSEDETLLEATKASLASPIPHGLFVCGELSVVLPCIDLVLDNDHERSLVLDELQPQVTSAILDPNGFAEARLDGVFGENSQFARSTFTRSEGECSKRVL